MCNPVAWTATKAFFAKAAASTVGKAVIAGAKTTAGKAVIGAGAAAVATKALAPSQRMPEQRGVLSGQETIDEGSMQARDRERRRARLAFGRTGTMLTGAQGAGAPAGGGKTLLGS